MKEIEKKDINNLYVELEYWKNSDKLDRDNFIENNKDYIIEFLDIFLVDSDFGNFNKLTKLLNKNCKSEYLMAAYNMIETITTSELFQVILMDDFDPSDLKCLGFYGEILDEQDYRWYLDDLKNELKYDLKTSLGLTKDQQEYFDFDTYIEDNFEEEYEDMTRVDGYIYYLLEC